MQVALVALQVDDWVADELSGPVERDVAPALDLEQLHASRREQRRRREQIPLLGRAAEGDDRRVLDEQQQVLLERARDPVARHAALQLERVAVGDESEPLDPQLARASGLVRR